MEIRCTVDKIYLAKSKEKQTPSIHVVLVSEVGETYHADLWLTAGALKQTVKTMREALEWDGFDLSLIDNTDLLKGKTVSAVVEEEEYEGKVRMKVKFINSLDRVTESPFSKEEKSALSKAFSEVTPSNAKAGDPF